MKFLLPLRQQNLIIIALTKHVINSPRTMSTLLLRLLPVALLYFCFPQIALYACVDSVRLDISSVKCYGLRNGIILVDTVFGGEPPYFYSIEGQSFSTNPMFDRLWPGVYTVYVRDASGCIKQWQATVPEPEELTVKLFADVDTIVAGEPVQLRVVVSPPDVLIEAMEWRPPNLFQSQNSLLQTVKISETTTFAIEVRTDQECIARDQLTVYVEKTNVYFPNVIKPGSNQDAYFTMFAGEGVARIVSMFIYSRGGGIVFERNDFPPNDPLKGWNGRWGNKPAQPGVYPWVTVIEFLDGTRKQFLGTVTVVN